MSLKPSCALQRDPLQGRGSRKREEERKKENGIGREERDGGKEGRGKRKDGSEREGRGQRRRK